ncbi:MAG TPA: polymer-forming cytoskeletal protein [Trueperaceae bacterium]|nr:polymer-forming cytoskeletal protein [Trueperaceae bacterium]
MFRRNDKAKPETVRKEPFTYIHRGTTLIGQLIGEGRVRVHGHVKGNVKVKGVLEVSQAGVVEGELVEADEVKILGRVRADVVAGGKVEIWSGGELIGNVRAASLDIEEGAFFTGTSEMLAPDGTPRASLASQPLAALATDAGGTPPVSDVEQPLELGASDDESAERATDELVMNVSQTNRAEPSEN